MTDNPFKRHKDTVEDTLDKTTKAMYNSDKQTLFLISRRKDSLKPEVKAYIDTLEEFVEGVEAGIIKHHWQFFKQRKQND